MTTTTPSKPSSTACTSCSSRAGRDLNARLVQVTDRVEAGELTDGDILLGAGLNDVEFVLRVLNFVEMARIEVDVQRRAERLR